MDELIPIHEMIAILYQWLLAKYTSAQNFPLWKVSGGFPSVNEIKRDLSRWLLANYTSENFRLLKSGCYTIQLQGSLLYADSHPIIYEIIPILYKWLLAKYPSIKTYAFSKVSVKLWNYRVPPPLGRQAYSALRCPTLCRCWISRR